MAKAAKTYGTRVCKNPLCNQSFTAKRVNQDTCSGKCRQAVYMAKQKRVIVAARTVVNIWVLLHDGSPDLPELRELKNAVNDLDRISV